MTTNKLLITGGTGSFGNTILKHNVDTDRYSEIVIFSRDEKKQDDMRHYYSSDKIKFEVGDVRDKERLTEVMRGVDYVFHAAALKQVPSSEMSPLEATKTNILGTSNVVSTAVAANVKNVVVLSTDKAVMPINAMGISKAMAEKVALSYARNDIKTKVVCTRYGNVLASRGSVLPLFVDQISKGKEVTITDPKMTRFLMSLDDSVNLVQHAFEHNETGKLFVKKSPAATIETLYEAVREIIGVKSNYKIIGPRHGEKKHETLVSAEEMLRANDQGAFYSIRTDSRTLNYSNYTTSSTVTDNTNWTDYNSENTHRLTLEETIDLLRSNREFNLLLEGL